MKDQELRNAGLKVTGPRVKVLTILEMNESKHLSAEDVYRILLAQDDDVGIATVYRVLTQFEAAGIVKRHNFEGGHAVFELDRGDHHDHLVCVKCGSVQEFVDDEIERRQHLIADQNQFEMTDHSLTIYGVCQACH
ncbi:MAG: ferric iron uptake transcriptional regulator [Coxiella sp. (in: Bacteria)]|nr:MAG: ferric iron uptake transcriptional regulator [Coxiella sp. (in: g-proteobacteria)]